MREQSYLVFLAELYPKLFEEFSTEFDKSKDVI